MPQSPEADYTSTAKVFHWLIVSFVVAQFAIAWMPGISRDTKPLDLVGWHLSVGAAILAVAVGRLIWRVTHPAPPPPSDLAPALQIVSRVTHYLLYALLILLPLMGGANAAARGWQVRLFGVIPLPQLLPSGSPLGRQMGDIHATTAIVFLVVIGLHVAGALYHAFVLHDRTFQRML